MNETSETPVESRKSRVIPFILILIFAVAIGFTIRHFKSSPPTPAEEGTWEVYFSEIGTNDGTFSLEKLLIAKLQIAIKSVDAALYDLDSAPVTEALILAFKRGVKVRVFTEHSNAGNDDIVLLKQAGILVRDDEENDGYMHHKFFVIDERYVWTGSYNTTYNGAFKNENNVIWIDSESLAYNFTHEFQEMFLSARYDRSSKSSIPFPKITLSDGTEISTYFAPKNDTITPILAEINSAEKSIYFMTFAFTHDQIGKAMRERFKAGVSVGGVFDRNQNLNSRYSEYKPMKDDGLPVFLDRNPGAMHHKTIVIDGETVITGSYNFSKNAETRNSENLLIIKRNRDIARAYLDEFDRFKD